MKHQLTNSHSTIKLTPMREPESVGFRPSMSGVIRHGVRPSKIGTFRVHLTLPPLLTQRLHVHKGKMSERWIRQVMVAAAYATPFHSLFQQPFSLSLSSSLSTTILLPFEPSLYTPASRECSTAILCYQTMNSNENKKPARQRFPKPTRCWSTPSTMRTSFAVVKSKYALFLFIHRPFPSCSFIRCFLFAADYTTLPLHDPLLTRGSSLLT